MDLLRDQTEYVIGRSRRSDIVLSDPRVSGRHAVIRLVRPGARGGDSAAEITDYSGNGLFVNGERLTRETPRLLRGGDHVCCVRPDPSVDEHASA